MILSFLIFLEVSEINKKRRSEQQSLLLPICFRREMCFKVISIREQFLQTWWPYLSDLSNFLTRLVFDFEWDSFAWPTWKMTVNSPLAAVGWYIEVLVTISIECFHSHITAVPWIDNFANILILISWHDFTSMIEVWVRVLYIKYLDLRSM